MHSTVQNSCLWEGKSRGGRDGRSCLWEGTREGRSCLWEGTREGRRRRRRKRRQLRVVHEEGRTLESENLITQVG